MKTAVVVLAVVTVVLVGAVFWLATVVTDLREKHTHLQETLAAVTGERDGARAELGALGAAHREQAADLADVRAEFKGVVQERDDTRVDLQLVRTQRDDLAADIAVARAELADVRSDLADLRTALEDAVQERDDTRADLQLARAQRDGLAADIAIVRSDLADLRTALEDAVQERDDTRADLQLVRTQRDDLAAQNDQAQSNLADVRDALADVVQERDALAEIAAAAGTAEELRETARQLRDEIESLKAQREPLLLRPDSLWITNVACTGSMEPKLTCLDRVSMLLDVRPEDIVVGAVINYGRCGNQGGALHRVMDIKIEDGVRYFWPKGDANDGPDGCWVHEAHVHSYMVAIEKNVFTENAPLRDAVMAAQAAATEAWEAFHALAARYCGDDYPYCPGEHIDELNAAYAHGIRASEHLRCWGMNAVTSEYPGHIPNQCEGARG